MSTDPVLLPLAARHRALGARMGPFAGWEMPTQYEGIVAEHHAVRAHAGLFDVSHMGRFWLLGPDAAAALRSVTTYDVTQMQPGGAHYSLACNPDGGIADDVFIYCLSPERWLVVHNAANAALGQARLRDAVRGRDAEVVDLTRDSVMLALQGPAALGLAAQHLGAVVAALPARTSAGVEWGGVPLLVCRTGYTGEDGVEVIAPLAEGGALWDALIGSGAAPCGLGARDTLRLEAALPLHGNDIGPATNPYEARLGWAVTLDDGHDFTGREALLRLRDEPRTHRLACIEVRGRGVPRAGYALYAADAAAGDALSDTVGAPPTPLATLTSGAHSPTLRTGIAMAYLPLPAAELGTSLVVDLRGRRVPAVVVRRPFYRSER